MPVQHTDEETDGDDSHDHEEELYVNDVGNGKAFEKKQKYTYFDFLDFYESRYYTAPFQVYRSI